MRKHTRKNGACRELLNAFSEARIEYLGMVATGELEYSEEARRLLAIA